MEFTALTSEQKHQFDSEGYLIVRNALSPDTVGRLLEAGDRLCASETTLNRSQSNGGQYDGFRNCISMDSAFLEILQNPATVPLALQLLGPRLQLMTSHLIYKKPNQPGTPATYRNPGWHRDIAYTPDDLGHDNLPRMELKIAYYLTDLDEPNSGVTLFAPGSNWLKEPISIPRGEVDPKGAVEPLVRAGDAVFFENRTYHAGAVNFTDRTSKMVMFGYGYSWLKPMDYVVQDDALLEGLDDIGKQLLGGLKDPEGRFIPGGVMKPLMDWAKKHGVDYRPFAYQEYQRRELELV